jgi:type IV pilus assembly protein PilC
LPEKQAKEFGQSEKNELFVLPEKLQEAEKEIVLNISEAKNGKLLLHKRSVDFIHLTGNPVIDAYNRVNNYFIDHSRIKIRDKAAFFRLLAVMINAGLPLIKSLKTLSGQANKSPKLQRALAFMAGSIEAGKSLSAAMQEFPDIFSEAQVGMIRSGEASGQLNKTLKDLAEETEKSASLQSKIKGALVYPIVILALLIAVVFVMMITVIPELTKLFAQTGKELPLPTRILINMSNFTLHYWAGIIVIFFGTIFGVSIWKNTRTGRYYWDLMMLNLPLFGEIIQKAVLSKFARSLSNLLKSGVPIIKSLEIVSNAVGNEVYKKRLFLTAEDMRRGIPMAENLADNKLFPHLLVNMIEIGEQTAQLENVTLKVAEFYDEEVENVVKSLTKIMEPIIIVIIGATVGGLVAAIMLPIIQLTNITGGFV